MLYLPWETKLIKKIYIEIPSYICKCNESNEIL